MCKKLMCLIFFLLVLGLTRGQALGAYRAVYWDGNYADHWISAADAATVRDGLADAGYDVLDADQLKAWMDGRIADGAPSVIVFAKDVAPQTVIETNTADCTLRKYLDAGGKIVFYGDIPFYNQGNPGGGETNWGDGGAVGILGFNAAGGGWDRSATVQITEAGLEWGLTDTWASVRPAAAADVDIILAADSTGAAAAWVKHYVPDDEFGGFVRLWDRGNIYSLDDLMRVAEYGLGGGGNPLARRPDPKDGAMLEQTWGTLSWKEGFYAVSHDLYMGTNFDDVNNGAADTFIGNLPTTTTTQIIGFIGFPFPDGLVPGTTYYWRVDEVNDANAASPWKGDVWSFWVPPKTAYDPTVSDGAEFVATDVVLGWTPGFGAKLHHVYFGDDLDTVTNAVGALPQSDTTFDPGPLEEGKTYYWRVDELEVPLEHKGNVWSFTTVPSIPVSDPSLVGWWTLDEGAGTNVVDWSGHGNHGTVAGDPEWADGVDGGALRCDGSGDWVPTGLMPADFGVDGGNAKTVTAWVYTTGYNNGGIYDMGSQSDGQEFCLRTTATLNQWRVQRWGYPTYDFDVTYPTRARWVHFAQVYNGTAGGNMTTLYADGVAIGSQAVDLNTANAQFVIGRYGSGTGFNGVIDDVRLYNKALTAEEIAEVMRGNTKLANNPVPGQNAIVDIRDVGSISWTAGVGAASHDVYFGTDRDAVAGADNSSPEFQGNQSATSLSLAGLVEFGGGDYYVRVDEVEAGGAVNAGTVWNFTVPARLIVDDFEAYNNIEEGQPGSNRIYVSWKDGYGTLTNGSQAGNLDPPFASLGVVRSGAQALPLSYDNAGKTSEATMTLPADKRDWTAEGVTKLELWFSGDSANGAERMFVALGNAVVYHPDDAATQDGGWNKWEIELTDFAGVDLTNVGSITIGFGTRNAPVPGGGAGTVYFDDIGLVQ